MAYPLCVNNSGREDEFAHPFWNVVVVVELIKKRDLYFYLTEGAIFFLCCVFTSYLKQRSNTSILRGYTTAVFRRFYWIGGISYKARKLSEKRYNEKILNIWLGKSKAKAFHCSFLSTPFVKVTYLETQVSKLSNICDKQTRKSCPANEWVKKRGWTEQIMCIWYCRRHYFSLMYIRCTAINTMTRVLFNARYVVR